MNYSKQYDLRPGDRIVLGLFETGTIKHYAIFLGTINGYEWVAENQKGSGVQIILADYFFSTVPPVFYIEQFTGSDQERSAMIQRAQSLEGAEYNVFYFNCEHYANYVQYGVAKSSQVAWGILLGSVGIALALRNR